MSLSSLIATHCPARLRPSFDRIQASPLGLRLARGVFWSVAGTVMSRGLMLGSAVLVARMLGKNVYGELGMIRSTVGMFGLLAGFGLGLTATKHVAEFRQNDPERAGRIIGLSALVAGVTGGILACGLLIFAPLLAERTIHAPHLAGMLRIGGLILLFSSLNGAQTGALAGFEAFKTIARVELSVGLISFPILLIGAHVGGLAGAVWALAINLGFNWLLNHLALRREAHRHRVRLVLKGCWHEVPVLWKFSLPALLASTTYGATNWACGALLVNRPDGYAEMGIYSAAYQWFNVLVFLPGLLSSVLLPVLAGQFGQGNKRQSVRASVLAIKINAVIVLPVVAFACALSPYIMRLYGNAFANGWPTLVAVLVTAAIVALQQPVTQIIHASSHMWVAFAMNCAWAVTFLVSTLVLIRFGAFGLALAAMISQAVHSTWTFGFIFWILRTEVQND